MYKEQKNMIEGSLKEHRLPPSRTKPQRTASRGKPGTKEHRSHPIDPTYGTTISVNLWEPDPTVAHRAKCACTWTQKDASMAIQLDQKHHSDPGESMQQIIDQIQATYGSLEEPNFSFRKQQDNARPYDELVATIIEELELAADEYTDLNDDSCFGYTLSRDGVSWILELSMVGPFAAFSRIHENGRKILAADDCDLTAPERRVLDLLTSRKLRIMRREELEQPIELRLFNTDPENTRIYQALFSDTDILPWAHSESW